MRIDATTPKLNLPQSSEKPAAAFAEPKDGFVKSEAFHGGGHPGGGGWHPGHGGGWGPRPYPIPVPVPDPYPYPYCTPGYPCPYPYPY